MPINTTPIWSGGPQVNWTGVLNAANTATDGTGSVGTAFTADATNGGLIQRLRLKPVGTNVASNLRIFLNNGGATGVASNNAFYGEVSLPATTASNTAAMFEIDYPMGANGNGLALPPGYRVTCCIATAVAAGWNITGIGSTFTYI